MQRTELVNTLTGQVCGNQKEQLLTEGKELKARIEQMLDQTNPEKGNALSEELEACLQGSKGSFD